MEKVKYKKAPELKPIHKWIVRIGRPVAKKGKVKEHWHWGFRYLLNREELRQAKASLKKGDVLEVFEARHKFVEAWHA
jgi:hypothetical protein